VRAARSQKVAHTEHSQIVAHAEHTTHTICGACKKYWVPGTWYLQKMYFANQVHGTAAGYLLKDLWVKIQQSTQPEKDVQYRVRITSTFGEARSYRMPNLADFS
jgi:hypothetical protein